MHKDGQSTATQRTPGKGYTKNADTRAAAADGGTNESGQRPEVWKKAGRQNTTSREGWPPGIKKPARGFPAGLNSVGCSGLPDVVASTISSFGTAPIEENRVESTYSWGRDESLANPLEQREWLKVLLRVWRPALSASEFLVLAFIFDRTILWGKTWEVITHHHFLDGVCTRDGTCYAPGLDLSRPTLTAALARLKALGAIHTQPARDGRTGYALNLSWKPATQSPAMIATPRKARTAPPLMATPKRKAEGGQKSFPPGGKKLSPLTVSTKAVVTVPKADSCGEDGPEAIRERLTAKAQTASAVSLGKRAAKAERLKTDAVGNAWQDACRRFHPTAQHLSLTVADCAILKQYLTRRFRRNGKEAISFLSWTVQHWLTIRASLFGWMNKTPSPEAPSIRWMVARSDKYEEQWNKRAALEEFAALPSREQAIRTRMVRMGENRETASAWVDQRDELILRERAAKKAEASLGRKAVQTSIFAQMEQQQAEGRKQWQELKAARSAKGTSRFADFDAPQS